MLTRKHALEPLHPFGTHTAPCCNEANDEPPSPPSPTLHVAPSDAVAVTPLKPTTSSGPLPTVFWNRSGSSDPRGATVAAAALCSSSPSSWISCRAPDDLRRAWVISAAIQNPQLDPQCVLDVPPDHAHLAVNVVRGAQRAYSEKYRAELHIKFRILRLWSLCLSCYRPPT